LRLSLRYRTGDQAETRILHADLAEAMGKVEIER